MTSLASGCLPGKGAPATGAARGLSGALAVVFLRDATLKG